MLRGLAHSASAASRRDTDRAALQRGQRTWEKRSPANLSASMSSGCMRGCRLCSSPVASWLASFARMSCVPCLDQPPEPTVQCLGHSCIGLPTTQRVSLLVGLTEHAPICAQCMRTRHAKGMSFSKWSLQGDKVSVTAYLCYPDELGRRVYPDNLHSKVLFLCQCLWGAAE